MLVHIVDVAGSEGRNQLTILMQLTQSLSGLTRACSPSSNSCGKQS